MFRNRKYRGRGGLTSSGAGQINNSQPVASTSTQSNILKETQNSNLYAEVPCKKAV